MLSASAFSRRRTDQFEELGRFFKNQTRTLQSRNAEIEGWILGVEA